jgi:F0F1-type ATP synthase assembly protein I
MSLQPQKNINLGQIITLGSELGFLIALPIVICIFLGLWIDKKLNTFPLVLLASILVGIVLTIVNVYKIVIPFLEKRSDNNKIIK